MENLECNSAEVIVRKEQFSDKVQITGDKCLVQTHYTEKTAEKNCIQESSLVKNSFEEVIIKEEYFYDQIPNTENCLKQTFVVEKSVQENINAENNAVKITDITKEKDFSSEQTPTTENSCLEETSRKITGKSEVVNNGFEEVVIKTEFSSDQIPLTEHSCSEKAFFLWKSELLENSLVGNGSAEIINKECYSGQIQITENNCLEKTVINENGTSEKIVEETFVEENGVKEQIMECGQNSVLKSWTNMEWTNDTILEFLNLYEQEAIIWNPLNGDHKDRNKVYEAWKRIQNSFSEHCSLKELKKKKDNLMATYRKLNSKARKRGETGTAIFQVFRPEWFAYEKMASFLHTVYSPRITKATEVKIPDNAHDIDEEYSNQIPLNNEDGRKTNIKEQIHSVTTSNNNESQGMKSPAVSTGGPPTGKKRKTEEMAHIAKRMDDAYHFLKQVATKPKSYKDESTLFCDLLCVKLQTLDEETRQIAMHEINNLMFGYRKTNLQSNYNKNNIYGTMNLH